LQHFSRFVMEQLLMQPGVIDVKSSFALDRIKDTTALPLRQLGGDRTRPSRSACSRAQRFVQSVAWRSRCRGNGP